LWSYLKISEISYFPKPTSLPPPSSIHNRGLTYVKLQNYPAALADYTQAIQLNPQEAAAYYKIACLYVLQNNPQDSCPWLKKVIEQDEKSLQLACIESDFDLIRSSPEFKSLFAVD